MNAQFYNHLNNILNNAQALLNEESLNERQVNFLTMILRNAQTLRETSRQYEGVTLLTCEQRHKLGNPLTPILGYAELLTSGTLGMLTLVQESHVIQICTSAQALRSMLDSMIVREKAVV